MTPRHIAMRRLRVCAFPLVLSAATLVTGTAADAQTVPDAPTVISPLRVETDVNDVNLVTGKTVLKTPTISVPAAPNLKFDWVQNAAPYVSGTIISSSNALPPGALPDSNVPDGTSEAQAN